MLTTKTILIISGILLAVVFTLPAIIMGALNTGNYIILILAALLIVYGTFFNRINSFIVYLTKNLWGKIVLILFSAFVLAILIFTIIITINIIDKANNPPKNETTVVVLGCRVREDGESTMLKTRLEAAYTYLTENKNVKCVLSGGQGNDEPMAEGLYMYNWLVEKGIDASRLYIEDKSTSTEENLEFTKKIIEENNLSPQITIITNEFHQYRAYRFAKEIGFESIYSYSAKTPWYFLPTYYIREVCGVAHMIFID